jgi:Cu(I)/Ag(I) efflux system membrane fusion protein/cobalt-zinc-cadmium efflux system membrane fusion protein
MRKLEKTGVVNKALTIRSPFKGIVTSKNAIEGGYIKPGTTVYRIADLSKVWVEAHIYEYELHLVKAGQLAEMTLPYLPGKIYRSQVSYVYPYLQKETRDVVIRVEFDNPDFALKPEMYVDIRIKTVADGEGLIIPDEAVIRSGERNIVFTAKGEGKFVPREVKLGMTVDGGNVQILTGLVAGETVVTSGQFLLDSESKLKEAIQKMMDAKSVPAPDPSKNDEDDFFTDMESEDEFFDDLEK